MKLIRKLKYPLTIILVVILTVIFFIIKKKLNNQKYELANTNNEDILIENIESDISETEILKTCHIDIKGAINAPGVYEISCDKNINDAISLAGGLTEQANTSVINLAKKITDEMVIIIYTNDEVKNSNVVDTVVKIIDKECNCPNIKNDGCLNTEIDSEIGNNPTGKLVNINSASLEELKNLPGIGESKAKSIIEYRDKYGNFNSIEDILNVNGIGESLYEQIKIYITT